MGEVSAKQTTIAEAAALDFVPWVKAEGGFELPSRDDFMEMMATYYDALRLAEMAMYVDKAKLMGMFSPEMEEGTLAFVQTIRDASQNFQSLLDFVGAAEARLLCAAAAHFQQEVA